MAEKLFTNVRLGLKIDTLENWGKSSLVLKKGEVAFATVAASAGTGLTEPVCMMKIGDGEKTFSQLDFNFYAKASDVLAACKSETALKAFINGVIADAGIATDEAMQELAGKVTTAEGKITTLEGKMTTVEGKAADNAAAILALQGLVGDQDVAARITAAINALDLANTYEAKGEAAKVSTALETYKTSNDAAVKKVADDLAGEIARAGVAEKANADAIAAIKDGTTIDSFADVESALAGKEAAGEAAKAEAAAKAYADGLAGNYDAKGSAAAAESAAKAYADGLAGNYDAAGTAAAAEAAAKKYTDEEIAEWVGDKTVAAQIAALDLANTYDAKGAAAAAETAAKSHATGLNTAMNTRVEALEAIDHEHANAAVLDGITAEKVAAWDAAEQNAKDYADGLDEAMDARVLALEGKFGEGEGNVESQISAAVAAEAKLREDADKELAADIKAIADDYLVEADKTELAGKITAIEGVLGDVESVAEYVDGAVKAEKERAEGIEGGLRTDVDAIKADYLKAADKQALQNQIDTIMSNPDAEGAINSINEFAQYVKDHGTVAEGFRTAIEANEDAIAAISEDYLVEADKTELQGNIDGVAGRMTTAEGKIGALETASATHATKTEVEAVAGRVTTAEGKITTLEGEMDAVEGRATALETKVGDKTVQAQISEAITALKIGDYAKASALAEAIAQHNTDKAALEAAIAKKADDSALAAIAKTGSTDDLVQGEMVIVFDCGGADVPAEA